MAGNRSISELKFHDNTTTISDGETCAIVSDGSTLSIDFKGSGTFTSVIECKVSHDSDWDERMAVDTKTLEMSTTPNNFNTWELGVTGIAYVRIRVTAISGSLTVISRLVG